MKSKASLKKNVLSLKNVDAEDLFFVFMQAELRIKENLEKNMTMKAKTRQQRMVKREIIAMHQRWLDLARSLSTLLLNNSLKPFQKRNA